MPPSTRIRIWELVMSFAIHNRRSTLLIAASRIFGGLALIVAATSQARSDLLPGWRAYIRQDYSRALKELQPAADQGIPEAQFYLGEVYEEKGALQNYPEAIRWFQKAAEQGLADAQLRLGFLYRFGKDGIPSDEAEAARWYLKAAEQGVADAQTALGSMYKDGDGVSQDEAEALKWYRMAADQGDSTGAYELGLLYATRKTVRRDYGEALKWYRKAAAQEWRTGFARDPTTDAVKELDLMTALGLATPEDYTHHIERVRSNAQRGDAKAELALGLLYDLGHGGLRDSSAPPSVSHEQRIGWYRKAAMQGLTVAQRYLADSCRYEDDAQAITWYLRAAEQGDTYSQMALAEVYDMARGVSKDSVEATKWYRRAAEAGNARAQKELGQRYFIGKGVTTNQGESLKWYLKAAEQGSVDAQSELAYRYSYPSNQNLKEAAKWCQRAAENGDEDSQLRIGEMYDEGAGVATDYREAMRWYRIAATNRHAAPSTIAEAQAKIGLLYYNGHGVSTDYTAAFNWLATPVKWGYAEAEKTLGWMYSEGHGVKQDNALAISAFKRAALHGDYDVLSALGQIYQNGEGVPKDQAEAARWFHRQANFIRPMAETGLPDAEWELGTALQSAGDFSEAVEWYEKSAKQGSSLAANALGILYSGGRGVPQDYSLAVRYFRQAAEAGDHNAQYNLAGMYKRGEGVPQDFIEAHKWYNLAALGLDRFSASARDELASEMTPGQIAKAQELAHNWHPATAASETVPDWVTTKPGKTSAGTRSTDKPSPKRPMGSGTGFIVSRQGHVLTNYHVISGCNSLTGKSETKVEPLTIVGYDAGNDLAILKAPGTDHSPASFSDTRRVLLGKAVIAVGYPLRGLLASGLQVTTGTISALAGIQDDTRMLQFTAPVQAGNSGGPLFDESGNVIGIVAGKLNAMKVAKVTGDIPENVNFAIKAGLAREFLDAKGIEYRTAPSSTRMETGAIAERARNFLVLIECYK
jgi:TPR repeat protein/stage V sporulation protein SpoVS